MYFLPVTFLAPLFCFLFLIMISLNNRQISHNRIFAVSCGSLLVSLLSALMSIVSYMTSHVTVANSGGILEVTSIEVIKVTVLPWLKVGSVEPIFGLLFDGLSMTMMLMVIIIGLIVQIFTFWQINTFERRQGFHTDSDADSDIKQDANKYQKLAIDSSHSNDIVKFFAYFNLLISAMILLVLADNLVLLYLGWELVGVCVYLLINFRPSFIKSELVNDTLYNPKRTSPFTTQNFFINRIGTVALIVGLFLLLKEFDSTNIHYVLKKTVEIYSNDTINNSVSDETNLRLITFLLAVAAMIRSAQIPMKSLLTGNLSWSSTTISALIQTVTMVASGVYLLVRFHPMFVLNPDILLWSVAVIGSLMMILFAVCAIVQTDIKRIVAYSTMSQMGFIFLVIGVGAWQTGLYHLITHSVYKSLLVLACGTLLVGVNQQQNIFKLGGLRERMPLIFWSFVFGCGSLMALPLTASFTSVNFMLQALKLSDYTFLYMTAIFGLFLTSIYSFRLLLCVFFGTEQTKFSYFEGSLYQKPILILLVFSTAVGAMMLNWFLTPLAFALPFSQAIAWVNGDMGNYFTQIFASISGIFVAWILHKNEVKKHLSENKQSS